MLTSFLVEISCDGHGGYLSRPCGLILAVWTIVLYPVIAELPGF